MDLSAAKEAEEMRGAGGGSVGVAKKAVRSELECSHSRLSDGSGAGPQKERGLELMVMELVDSLMSRVREIEAVLRHGSWSADGAQRQVQSGTQLLLKSIVADAMKQKSALAELQSELGRLSAGHMELSAVVARMKSDLSDSSDALTSVTRFFEQEEWAVALRVSTLLCGEVEQLKALHAQKESEFRALEQRCLAAAGPLTCHQVHEELTDLAAAAKHEEVSSDCQGFAELRGDMDALKGRFEAWYSCVVKDLEELRQEVHLGIDCRGQPLQLEASRSPARSLTGSCKGTDLHRSGSRGSLASCSDAGKRRPSVASGQLAQAVRAMREESIGWPMCQVPSERSVSCAPPQRGEAPCSESSLEQWQAGPMFPAMTDEVADLKRCIQSMRHSASPSRTRRSSSGGPQEDLGQELVDLQRSIHAARRRPTSLMEASPTAARLQSPSAERPQTLTRGPAGALLSSTDGITG